MIMALSKKEQSILNLIRIPSENDPNKPEFPPGNPKFPATPAYRINVKGFSNVWLKDESVNPTGTHNDRMAWEMIVTYHDFLKAKKLGQMKKPLPRMSLISSGSAAIAIQTQLKNYSLPNLKVLVDVDFIKENAIKTMKELGCEIYETNLAKKSLTSREILALTHNSTGFDITSNQALGPNTRFYDWMSFEIINTSPDFCFIPFGTGNLYENILNINKKEISTNSHDPRFTGDVKILRNCNFFGATSNNPKTKADKLYSPHLPFVEYDEQWIKLYKYSGFCGPKSSVFSIKENYLDAALEIANSKDINCGYSGIAGLALLLQMRKQIPRYKKILVVNTGNTKYIKN
jgi:hypothetical protein